MKKVVYILLIGVLFCGSVLAVERGRPGIKDNLLVAENGWPIRGENPRYNQADKAADPNYWRRLRNDFNLNTVRILCYQEPQNWSYGDNHGCGWDCNLPDANEMLPYLDTWVDAAAEKGFYCIIDYHPVGGHGRKESMKWWSVVAPRYKDRTCVIYELCNEPVAWWPRNYTDEVIDWQEGLFVFVRSLAPETHLICWSFPKATKGMTSVVDQAKSISYKNASVAFHAYSKSDEEIHRLRGKYPVINSEIGGFSAQEYTRTVKQMEELGIESWILLDGTDPDKAVEVTWQPDPFFRRDKKQHGPQVQTATFDDYPCSE